MPSFQKTKRSNGLTLDKSLPEKGGEPKKAPGGEHAYGEIEERKKIRDNSG